MEARKINELRKEVENNCDVLEPAPIYPNEEESFWEEESCAKCNPWHLQQLTEL